MQRKSKTRTMLRVSVWPGESPQYIGAGACVCCCILQCTLWFSSPFTLLATCTGSAQETAVSPLLLQQVH
jgi:hypothetical protein